MEESMLYIGILAAFLILVVFLEREKIKNIDIRKLLTILIVIFFIGSTLAYLFTW